MTTTERSTTTDGWPTGQRVMITGHRDIRGEQGHALRHALIRVLQSLKERGTIVGVSGMAVGADCEFVEACIYTGVPYVAAVPVPDHGSAWPPHARALHAEQIRRASLVVHVWEDPAYLADSYAAKMHARNRWLLDHVAAEDGIVIAAWDGRRSGGTWATVDGALKRGRKVLVIDPKTCQLRIEKPPQKPEPVDIWKDNPFAPEESQERAFWDQELVWNSVDVADRGRYKPCLWHDETYESFFPREHIERCLQAPLPPELPKLKRTLRDLAKLTTFAPSPFGLRTNMGRMSATLAEHEDLDREDSATLMQAVPKIVRSGR